MLEKLFGQAPERVRLALARKDLGDFLVEGQHAGVLHTTQLQLAQNFFLVATQPVARWMTPLSRVHVVPQSATRVEALKEAEQLQATELVIGDQSSGELKGYLRTAEMIVNDDSDSLARYLNPLVDIRVSELYGEAIMRLQSSGELMARVIDDDEQTLGVVTLEALSRPLLGGPLSALHGQSVTTDFPFGIQST